MAGRVSQSEREKQSGRKDIRWVNVIRELLAGKLRGYAGMGKE